jgi:hypothetical protein
MTETPQVQSARPFFAKVVDHTIVRLAGSAILLGLAYLGGRFTPETDSPSPHGPGCPVVRLLDDWKAGVESGLNREQLRALLNRCNRLHGCPVNDPALVELLASSVPG